VNRHIEEPLRMEPPSRPTHTVDGDDPALLQARLAEARHLAAQERGRRRHLAEELRRLERAHWRAEARLRRKLARAEGRVERERRRRKREVRRLRTAIGRIQSRRAWQVVRVLDRTPRTPAGYLLLPLRITKALLVTGGSAPAAPAPKKPRQQVASKSAMTSERPTAPHIPTLAQPAAIPRRPELVVAGVLDPFSVESFKHEFTFVNLRRDDWRQQLKEAAPAILLVESAWRGADGRWVKALSDPAGPADDVVELVEHCRADGIPTVFWNKEDPPNFDRFIRTARLFDHVFTVDEGCLERYEQELPRGSVGVLPFAAQPRLSNPAAVPGEREYDVAFAGTYFATKHPERREQMDMLLRAAQPLGLHIFSRHTEDDRYTFPPPLADNVVGSLPYEQMAAAYKRYKVFLNVNSVTQSRSMCSRRIFECLASGTPVLSTPAEAYEGLFGIDAPIMVAHDAEEAERHLRTLLDHPEIRDRIAARGLRAVMAEHTYTRRVDQLLSMVLPEYEPSPPPLVSAIVCTMRPEQLPHIVATLNRQTAPRIELVLVTHGWSADVEKLRDELPKLENVQVVCADERVSLGTATNLGFLRASGDVLTKMDDDDHYGSHYLEDQVAALDYSDAEIVGKRSLYAYVAGLDVTVLRFPGEEHRDVTFVAGATICMRRGIFEELMFPDVPVGIDTRFFEEARASGARIYATDRFNFLYMRGHQRNSHTWKVPDERFLQNSRFVHPGLHVKGVEV
jgi:glycosyltransferase involved in cell wall biosynthesis